MNTEFAAQAPQDTQPSNVQFICIVDVVVDGVEPRLGCGFDCSLNACMLILIITLALQLCLD